MLKDYVTKLLGGPAKSKGRHEQKPEEPRPAPEGPAEDIFEVPPDSGEPEDPRDYFIEEPPQAPEELIYETGVRAYRAREFPQALEAFLQAAGQGHAEAQYLCGQMYRQGIGAAANGRLALTWYKRAAKQGYLNAQLTCAAMFESGEGTEINVKQALYWYEQAAKQGDLQAQLKCGRMYYRGRAETRNPQKARRWLETAAGNGSEDAQKLLSELF